MIRPWSSSVRRWCLAGTAAAVLALSCAAQPAAGANISVGVSYFYDDLSPYGQWVDEPRYGWCWSPHNVSSGWRPYTDGYWAYTDVGWTWVSDEPWGWAAYHYGRWFYDPYEGWVWVPGTDWAPAWVTWRYSPDYDYVGWAPLPPDAGWNGWGGLTFVNVEQIPTRSWCFVRQEQLCDRDLSRRLFPVTQNVTCFRRTQDAPHLQLRGGQPFNPGVSVATIQQRAGRPIPRMRLADLGSRPRGGSQVQQRGALAFFRPHVNRSPGISPQRGIERQGNQWSGNQPRAARPQPMQRPEQRVRNAPWSGRMDRSRPNPDQRAQPNNQWRQRRERPAQMNGPARPRGQRMDQGQPGNPPDVQPRPREWQRPQAPDMHRPQPPERQQPLPQEMQRRQGPPQQQWRRDTPPPQEWQRQAPQQQQERRQMSPPQQPRPSGPPQQMRQRQGPPQQKQSDKNKDKKPAKDQ